MAGIRYKGQIFSGTASYGSADDVSYDNSDSGLSAANVQDALDELVSDIDSLSASDIAYSNSSSGLTATNAQDAVDELNSKLVENGFEVPKNTTVTIPKGYYLISFIHSNDNMSGSYLWAVGSAWATPVAIKVASEVTITSTTSEGNEGSFKWNCSYTPKCVFTRLM